HSIFAKPRIYESKSSRTLSKIMRKTKKYIKDFAFSILDMYGVTKMIIQAVKMIKHARIQKLAAKYSFRWSVCLAISRISNSPMPISEKTAKMPSKPIV